MRHDDSAWLRQERRMHRNRKRHHAVHALATNVNCNLMIDASTSLGTRGFTRTVS